MPATVLTASLGLSFVSLLSLVTLAIVYFFLITEKLNKVIVSMLGAIFLIVMQVFRSSTHTSQENAFQFISHNLDVLFFVIGMMVLVGIVRESGAFEASAIWLVKKINGNPHALLGVIALLTLVMTTFFSNIPTILILTPILIVLIKALKLPYLPYLFMMVVIANIAGAMTPISDPTTYYQAKEVGLSFREVITNSGSIVILLSLVSYAYTTFVFRKDLRAIKISAKDVSMFKPASAIRSKRMLYRGIPLLLLTIGVMISKNAIFRFTGWQFDNATITLGGAFLAMLIFHRSPDKVFKRLIDWEIIFFFMGLFIVVGALEFTHVIEILADGLVHLADGNLKVLTLLISVGSALLSTFIDNVPYNITMVGAIKAMAESGIEVYPLWWVLNLGTSIGGAGSPIAAACNVVAFGQAEKEKFHTTFFQYLKLSLPLVVINSLIAFAVVSFRFL